MMGRIAAIGMILMVAAWAGAAGTPRGKPAAVPKQEESRAESDAKMPVVFEEDFEKDGALEKWQPMDPAQWKIDADGKTKVLSLHKKKSAYKPKVRSPSNFALIRDVVVGDFVLDLKMKSTHKDYAHRDLCLFFGHQDPMHFYYVHIALKADSRAHLVLVVDGEPRVGIPTERTEGVVWGETWHDVRIVRKVETGTVEVYFDNMDKPIMKTVDKRFAWGRVGVGSFDDIGHFDDITIRGVTVEPPKKSDAPKPDKPAKKE